MIRSLVGEDGGSDAVVVDIEVVDALRHAVKEKNPNALANCDAFDLTVLENRAKYDVKESLSLCSSIEAFGTPENEAFIVVAREPMMRMKCTSHLIPHWCSTLCRHQDISKIPEDEKGCLSTGAHVWECYLLAFV
ncbi:uncharacterized protein PHALS_13261 [Plasmopara halstedii]|uniref:Uncharacterized protein n=1 Tax=Plasmopara halstedii TaxID=4781 RepID=A0A0P1API0_PLAHL|nr:uncharacterized protein PHALS_13261 [Plasmopara halstedii]CEG43036.1 hypothetical protein PHALS_13261 [Plasmopara halstedii]|eukprot:XP_024579405.1 hypothetical protein PHALS_13261 [Plasmopara halstedii]